MTPGFRRGFILVIIFFAFIAIIYALWNPLAVKPEIEVWSQTRAHLEKDEIETLTVAGDQQTLTYTLNSDGNADKTYTSSKEGFLVIDTIISEINIERANQDPPLPAIQTTVDAKVGGTSWWSSILTFMLPLIIIVAIFIFIMRRAGGGAGQAMNFSKSRARMLIGNQPEVTFDDVAGAEESKEELQEIVEFLKYPEKFLSIGARIPKGVLLVGPPGTGKTLISRAVAGEAGVPFFSISGSEFVEMFVGVGASRVRDLFEQAKRAAPSIVFIDEIDAVGRHRGSGMGGGHDEREQTLNQILVEMDGFDTHTNVIIIAATNRPDILDPALLRPGRFDRQVVMDSPDVKGRTAILAVHAKTRPLAKNVDMEIIAKQTPGFTGADLANLINEASILAARRGKTMVEQDELEEAIDRVSMGPERKSRVISQKEKELTAYHEAGHALVGQLLPNVDPIHKVSIIARGMAGGYTKALPEDRKFLTLSWLKDQLGFALGGRAAEVIIFDEISTGASSDLSQVTNFARRMVKDWGMSQKLGPRTYGNKEQHMYLGRMVDEQKDYGDEIANEIDREINILIDDANQLALNTLTENKDRLVHLAKRLIAEETLEGKALEKAFTEKIPAKE
ncbi:MAG: ATP-dependent zinc metalloprotease FtsH [Chloroflexi bacterium]|jgi:cell division protease FtsH|nr:ATP-dependent zinc metalloprotease FtsH [Chloroflexota bacterium]MBT7079898.1 ATP-dependent zinc metalloprotease FtsH [Chloroflexota bacterium]